MARTKTEVMDHLRDVCLTTTSPFTDDLSAIHSGAIHRNLEFVADQGIRTVVPCGNTGEFHALTLDECTTLVQETVDAVGSDCCVVAGVGYNIPTCIQMIRTAADAGADAAMIVPPNFTFQSPAGLKDYYLQVIDASPLPVVLYKRYPILTDATLAELVQHDNIVGVKYGVNDLNAFRNLVQTAGSDAGVVWICGTAERWAPFFHLAGAEGFSSGMGNFVPGKSLALRDALKNGDMDMAMEIQREFVDFEELRQLHDAANNVPAVKAAMDLAQLYGGPVRPPITALSPEDQQAMEQYVRRLSPVGEIPEPAAS